MLFSPSGIELWRHKAISYLYPLCFPGGGSGKDLACQCRRHKKCRLDPWVWAALCVMLASLVAQMVKNMPAVQEIRVQSLGQEDPLEMEMATHSSILAWKAPWTEEPGGLQSVGSQRVRHDWVTNTCIMLKVLYMFPYKYKVFTVFYSWNAYWICKLQKWERKLTWYPWGGKIPWRRAWQPTAVFLPGDTNGQRSLVGYSP